MEKGVLYPILFSFKNLTTPSALISPNAEQPVSSTALTTFTVLSGLSNSNSLLEGA